ncbi:MAG: hypothetical protein HY674_15675 [Chloroflexi bacterium]|nr:hypothetical protein [Chloroflexota bacterium]
MLPGAGAPSRTQRSAESRSRIVLVGVLVLLLGLAFPFEDDDENEVEEENWSQPASKSGCCSAGGWTVVPLEFAPRQSWFVVFREPANAPKAKQRNLPVLATVGELGGAWAVKFDPKWGGPESVSFKQLEDWTQRLESGIRHDSGKATYTRTFDLPEAARTSGQQIFLDWGKVKNVAEVRLNDRPLGVVWTAPWHVEITKAVQPTGNRLEVDVVNLWPNRLIGDAALPPDQRFTVTNVKKFKPNSPLLESGLLGPVTLRMVETAVGP